MAAVAPTKKKKPQKSKKAELLKYLSSVKLADVFSAKNKKAKDNLKRAGLVKSH